MAWFRRNREKAGESANEVAIKAARSGGSIAATITAAIALVFSGYSLWETSLKHADLSVYVTGVVSYARDVAEDGYIRPWIGFEVFAIPITIANGGARDAPVLALQLDAKNPKTGLTARFEATYTADAAYFTRTDGKEPRPKTPFSALVIAGRSAWTGTVLFYPVSYSNEKALTPMVKAMRFLREFRNRHGGATVSEIRASNPDLPEFAELDEHVLTLLKQNDKVEVTLKLVSPAPSGWLERALGAPVQPITLTLDMPPELPGAQLEGGAIVRLKTVARGS